VAKNTVSKKPAFCGAFFPDDFSPQGLTEPDCTMPLPPLDEGRIRSALSPASAEVLQQLTLLDQTHSTNDVLLQLPAEKRHAHAVLADQQIAGRGRRGRRWQSPAGSNIYFSLGWNFSATAEDLSCLPLTVGVSSVRALERLGLAGMGLKWPNDIWVDGKKLGGILLESTATAGGLSVIAGVGLNVAMPADSDLAAAIEQPWTSVCELLAVSPDVSSDVSLGTRPGTESGSDLRDRLAGWLLDEMLTGFGQFAISGFHGFQTDWQRLDVLRDQTVTVSHAGRDIAGTARGIDGQGRLRVVSRTSAGVEQTFSFESGEVSVRPSPHQADK